MLLEAVLMLVLFLLLWSWWRADTAGRIMPPGPIIFPIVGSKFVGSAEDARKFKINYGNIVRTQMGSQNITLLCDYQLIKEAFLKMEFADRPHWKTIHFLTEGREAGVIMSNGQRWMNARRFLLRNLRNLGMGKSHLDGAIQEEANMLVEDFKKFDGKSTSPPSSINIAVLNVIWQLVASRRYKLDDQELHDFIGLIKSLQDDTTSILLPDLFPLVNYLPGFIRNWLTSHDLVAESVRKGRTMIQEVIQSHKEDLDRNQPRDVIDEYLLEMDKEDSELAFFFSEEDLLKCVFDLFGAGFDTTSSTLRWVILYMAAHPKIQQRVQKEIDSVVPRDTLPSHIQRAELPYLDATLHEILRRSSLIPFAIFHATTQDTELGGYFFPKGTNILGCSVLCHEDPRYWPDPHTFDPEHFLDQNGKFLSHKEGFLPFGLGKRQCLGEALARMELFIFAAALLQNFTFAPPRNQWIDLEPAQVPFNQFSKDQNILITIRK